MSSRNVLALQSHKVELQETGRAILVLVIQAHFWHTGFHHKGSEITGRGTLGPCRNSGMLGQLQMAHLAFWTFHALAALGYTARDVFWGRNQASSPTGWVSPLPLGAHGREEMGGRPDYLQHSSSLILGCFPNSTWSLNIHYSSELLHQQLGNIQKGSWNVDNDSFLLHMKRATKPMINYHRLFFSVP